MGPETSRQGRHVLACYAGNDESYGACSLIVRSKGEKVLLKKSRSSICQKSLLETAKTVRNLISREGPLGEVATIPVPTLFNGETWLASPFHEGVNGYTQIRSSCSKRTVRRLLDHAADACKRTYQEPPPAKDASSISLGDLCLFARDEWHRAFGERGDQRMALPLNSALSLPVGLVSFDLAPDNLILGKNQKYHWVDFDYAASSALVLNVIDAILNFASFVNLKPWQSRAKSTFSPAEILSGNSPFREHLRPLFRILEPSHEKQLPLLTAITLALKASRQHALFGETFRFGAHWKSVALKFAKER